MLLKDMQEPILKTLGCSFMLAWGFWSEKETHLCMPKFWLTSRLIYGVMNLLSLLKLGVMFGLKGVIFGI
jgi:hypothetical protein